MERFADGKLRLVLAACTVAAFCAGSAVCMGVGCTAPTLPSAPVAPGSYRVSMDEWAEGRQRSYWVHVPRGLGERGPFPLVVALHGGGSSARTLESRAGLDAAAERHDFLVVYPNGEGVFGMFRHWNAGHCCGPAELEGRDDLGFVRRVVEDVGQRLPIDRERMYFTGFSNGGMLAWRFAAEHAELVAGVAPIAATLEGALESSGPDAGLPEPTRGVPLLAFYGREDRRVPAERVEASLDLWAQRSGCRSDPEQQGLGEGRIRLREWRGCDAGAPMAAYEIEGWAHRWPGPHFMGDLEDSRRDFDAAEILWQFFDSN